MKKTVKQLLDQYTDEQILKRYFEKYPDQVKSKKGYESALEELRSLPIGESDMTLYCELYGCHGLVEGDDTRYGIGFGWEKFLGCKMARATLDNLCNALYEITYHGYSSKSTDKFWKDMFSHVAKVKKELKEQDENNRT